MTCINCDVSLDGDWCPYCRRKADDKDPNAHGDVFRSILRLVEDGHRFSTFMYLLVDKIPPEVRFTPGQTLAIARVCLDDTSRIMAVENLVPHTLRAWTLVPHWNTCTTPNGRALYPVVIGVRILLTRLEDAGLKHPFAAHYGVILALAILTILAFVGCWAWS